MSRNDKLIHRLLGKPKDFTYDELVKVMTILNYYEVTKGKTAGSRRAFVNKNTKHVIRLHKQHPGNILKAYQIKQTIEELKKQNLI